MDKERTEDLNPHAEDVEEKVKRMLDPRIPDAPAQTDSSRDSAPKKTIEIQGVSTALDDSTSEESLPSAPELPSFTNKLPKSKKVILPMTNQVNDAPDNQSASQILPDADIEPTSAPKITKINIAENDEAPEEVAEKLNQAIASLDSKKTEEQDEQVVEDINEDKTESEQPTNINEDEVIPPEPDVFTAPETDKAVEDIVESESDELLEVADAIKDTDEPVTSVKKPRQNLWQLFKGWWAKPAFRWAVIIIIVGGALAATLVPASRYFVLNTVGVSSSSSLLVLDESTAQPLKNVEVKVGSVTNKTDAEGRVYLRKLKLGPTHLSIQKRAFAPVSKKITIGFGSNPLGDFQLKPTGSQYVFRVVDFLSTKPIGKVEASSGEAVALSNDKGEIKLTIDKTNDEPLQVTIKGKSYRTEKLVIKTDDKAENTVKLVPARKQVFVSKRTGKYNIYGIYVDGKDEKLILAGSGSEREDMVLVPHPTSDTVAYVSTRGNQRNSDGFLLSNLILINSSDNTTTNITASERIRIIDWSGDRLVYVVVTAGSSANSPKRYRLMSYDYLENTEKELASSNFFNDVILVNGAIYYAPSSAYQTGITGFYKVTVDGTDIQTLFKQEVWNIFRTNYDNFALSVQQQWFEYRLGAASPSKLNSAPANQESRTYVGSPDAKHSIWVDKRDGKGVLLVFDITTKNDKTLRSQSGLDYPIRWLNDTAIIYRVKTDQETADYAISIQGGEPLKIRDVTNSGGSGTQLR